MERAPPGKMRRLMRRQTPIIQHSHTRATQAYLLRLVTLLYTPAPYFYSYLTFYVYKQVLNYKIRDVEGSDTRTGPNDASSVVWALSEYFIFYFV
jgi:hypothetical protein